MIKHSFIISIINGFLFISCATMYQPQSVTGGYSETQLDKNMFRVRFNGNGYTSSARSSDFCLLRSAELCKENGYKYFIIVDESSGVSQSQYTTPTTTNTSGSATAIGNSVYGNATSTTYGGQTYTVSRPSNENTIICFLDKPKNSISYNADYINKSIREKYNVKQSATSGYSGLNDYYNKPKKKTPEGWNVE